jgi:hypothetical protein
VEALKQGIVQLAGDARPLADASVDVISNACCT